MNTEYKKKKIGNPVQTEQIGMMERKAIKAHFKKKKTEGMSKWICKENVIKILRATKEKEEREDMIANAWLSVTTILDQSK